MDSNSDGWFRTNQLMDHLEDTGACPEEWTWYNDNILRHIRDDLGLGDRYSDEDIRHVIGLINVNAVCLQFPKICGAPCTEAYLCICY